MHSYLLLALIPSALAAIAGDLNCTVYDQTAAAFVYAPSATICSNAISDAACTALYPEGSDGPVTVGEEFARPFQCYTTEADGAPNADMKRAAVAQCAKTCGFCCNSDAYSCPNAQFPSMNCATVTAQQCLSQIWRPIIATECPAACGFCNEGGCVDAVVECANDRTICNSVGLQDFVNTNCQRTCGRCPSTTGAAGAVTTASSGTCTSFAADFSPNCAAWAGNGFCDNAFYTAAHRRTYCASTCRIC